MDMQMKMPDTDMCFGYATGHASCTVEKLKKEVLSKTMLRTHELTRSGRWGHKPDQRPSKKRHDMR